MEVLSSFVSLVSDHPWITTVAGLVASTLAASGVFSFLRRPKTTASQAGAYFAERQLLSPPMERPAYSDRMAYVLAELSDLAYYEFEGRAGYIDAAVEQAVRAKLEGAVEIKSFLETFSTGLLSSRSLSLGFLEDVLRGSGFELLGTINVDETQAIACKRVVPGEPSYVVIAFRGTEKKISDWLTDADAVPIVDGLTRVHCGFHKAFLVKTDDAGRTVRERMRELIESAAAHGEHGPLPLFITGHSLGGALALLATRNLGADINGACYTFGAPRIANYEYFEGIKTPIYRIVNSSDVIPRVPPGAFIVVVIALVRLLSWLTSMFPKVSSLFDRLEAWLDKLNGYRHVGDLRYLTDVAAGRFEDVQLLSNPPAIDRTIWAWKHVAASLFVPLQCHSMLIYRKKLVQIATRRNRAAPDGRTALDAAPDAGAALAAAPDAGAPSADLPGPSAAFAEAGEQRGPEEHKAAHPV